jgi:hypothetical protein
MRRLHIPTSAVTVRQDLKNPQSHDTGGGPRRDLRNAPDADGGDEAGENLARGDLFIVTE